MAGVITGLPVLSTGRPLRRVVAGSQIQVSEAMLGQAMQNAYSNGASPDLWVVPPGPKRTISTFTGRSTTQVLVGKTEVVSTVDIIATDFGRIKVTPSRWVPLDVALLIDGDYAAVAPTSGPSDNIYWREWVMRRRGCWSLRMGALDAKERRYGACAVSMVLKRNVSVE